MLGAIAGDVAEPLFGLPAEIAAETRARLDPALRAVAEVFLERYASGRA